jgi:hypothetical protein
MQSNTEDVPYSVSGDSDKFELVVDKPHNYKGYYIKDSNKNTYRKAMLYMIGHTNNRYLMNPKLQGTGISNEGDIFGVIYLDDNSREYVVELYDLKDLKKSGGGKKRKTQKRKTQKRKTQKRNRK